MSTENSHKHKSDLRENEGSVCITFASGQQCPFEDRCRFLHNLTGHTVHERKLSNNSPQEQSLSQLDTTPAFAQQHNEGSGNTETRRLVRQRPCRFFLSGHCRNGEGCAFLHPEKPKQSRTRSAAPCRHFNSTDGCRFGDNCKFAHVKDVNSVAIQASNPQKKRVCRYFISTGCMFREKCTFHHPREGVAKAGTQIPEVEAAVAEGFAPGSEVVRATPKPRPAPMKRPQSEFTLKSLNDEEIEELRQGEVVYLKKRYPKTETVPQQKTKEESYKIRFVPSDPDWPYDVKALEMMLHFRPDYPKKVMEMSLPQDQPLPESVRRSVSFVIEDWLSERFMRLEKKGRIELVLRAFLRWLDRRLEGIFTDALGQYKRELVAKAAGIELIPARHLQAKYKEKEEGNDSSGDEDKEAEERTREDVEELKPWVEGDEEGETKAPAAPTGLDPSRKGTELQLKGLELYDSVGTLTPVSIKMVICCQRCKTKEDVVTPPDRVNSAVCRHCHAEQLIKYRHSIIHSFSSILGYLDLSGCAVVDVILFECDFKASCLRCNREQRIGGLPPGQVKDVWCCSCHAKMSVRVDSNQFTVLQSAQVEVKSGKGAHRVDGTKVIKAVKDLAIQEGKPLPDQGTCKHYSKSYRWLRFPCCGKAYPCDVCHDKAEGDHDMKFANRMICGFCGKEQPYSADRPCVACGNNVTRKASEHWEGGKGCRDKIKMSRNDDKKYANTNKTVSRHSQLNTQQKKKVIKLRHT